MCVLVHMCTCAFFWNTHSIVGRTATYFAADIEASTADNGYVLVMPSSYSTSTSVNEIFVIVAGYDCLSRGQ